MARKKKNDLLASGGGNATASGVRFQATVAAGICVEILAERPLDARLGLGAAKATSIRFETEVPVDDILVATDSDGWVFFQGKNSLTNSTRLSSEIGKTCAEIARIWEACASGSGDLKWNRPLTLHQDAIVIAVGPTTSGKVKVHLARALDALRGDAEATLSKDQADALKDFRTLLNAAVKARGGSANPSDTGDILQFVHVLEYDFSGPLRTAATEILSRALEDDKQATAGFAVLEQECERLMSSRGGTSPVALRATLARSGISPSSPPDFRKDVQALKDRTERVKSDLADYQKTKVNGSEITINRSCTRAVVEAAAKDSFVLVGEPGAGKSAVINAAAAELYSSGSEVIILAADQLQHVESMEGLTSALGLKHPIEQVLANWPGSGTAYLFIDALDAFRFGKGEALFRNLMRDVLRLAGDRWRVIASIRSFDLFLGQQFRNLFVGAPPRPELVDPRFQAVRHIRVPEWSKEEFEELTQKIPALKTALENAGDKLADLARTPFNTKLLAELLSDGIPPEAFGRLKSQLQLLELYWDWRVRPLGNLAEQCLRQTVSAMVQRRRLQARKLDASAGTSNAIDDLLRNSVLVTVAGDREVAFRHHIL